jgi:hypothetical protein
VIHSKFKQMLESRTLFSKIANVNDYNTIKPFLLGCQMEYRRFGNYIFTKNNTENINTLEKRHFKDFKSAVYPRVTWELQDDLMNFGDNIMYNEKYNIMVIMIPEKFWSILNTAINIAEKSVKDIQTQRDIVVGAFKVLQ